MLVLVFLNNKNYMWKVIRPSWKLTFLKCARGFLQVQVFFVFFVSILCLLFFCKILHFQGKFFTFLETYVLKSAASNVLENANLITLTKSSTENDRNLTAKVVATRWGDDRKGDTEMTGEKVWQDYSFFEARRFDYNMEKFHSEHSELSWEHPPLC